MKFILGKKIAMSQIFKDEKTIPITLVEAGPVVVVQIKGKDKDGYNAVQVGFGEKKSKNISKALKVHFKGLGDFRWLKEFRLKNEEPEQKIGDKIDVSTFEEGDKVKISGISKSKGFQGVVKRHGFHGGPKSHGQKDRLRAPGSIGGGGRAGGRVAKGMKMAGRMGGLRFSLKDRKIIFIDKESNVLAIKGALPGKKGDLIEISKID